MGLTVKHVAANAEQLHNGQLIVVKCKQMGGTDVESMAGAVATCIQESDLHNNLVQDSYGSAGLFGQRAIYFGGYQNTINVPLAIQKFLESYLSYRKKGQGWLEASNSTQHSQFPSAPAPWYQEGVAFAHQFASGSAAGAGSVSTKIGPDQTETRTQPYEFSRGSANGKETSWDCAGRLATEVKWRRFMRNGALWYASDNFLSEQPTVYRIGEFDEGVVSLSFDFDVRRNPAEATLQVVSTRYGILPGDVIELLNEGPASKQPTVKKGKPPKKPPPIGTTTEDVWLVSDVRRSLFTMITDVNLVRPTPKLQEPAPQTITVNVGGNVQTTSSGGSSVEGPAIAQKVYEGAQMLSDMRLPYVWGGGHSPGQMNTAHPGGLDCSGSVCWCLFHAGIWTETAATVSGSLETWGEPGRGKYFTVECNGGHTWIRFNGIGKHWRMDTSPYGCPGLDGPQMRDCPRPEGAAGGFVERHWNGL